MQDKTPPNRPWWKEPYVWMVIGGPVSAIVASLITAVFIFQGPDRLVPEEEFSQSQAMREEIQRASGGLQPALVGRNHSATGGPRHAQP